MPSRTHPSVLAPFAAAFVLSAAVPSAGRSQVDPPDSVVARLRSVYEAGFGRIAVGVPDSAKGPASWPLSALVRFKTLNVRWARIEGRGFFALERGSRAAGWIAIIPPENAFFESVSEVLTLDPNPQLSVIRIRPVDVTETWAGLFLVNAISHLADRVLRVTPPGATPAQVLLTQFRAYNLELMAADGLSNGGMREALDSVLDLAHEPSIQRLARDAPRLAVTHLALLSGPLAAGDPQSFEEKKLRAGFITMALILRYGERQALDLDTILAAIDAIERGDSAR
jgi:hypothetical protein